MLSQLFIKLSLPLLAIIERPHILCSFWDHSRENFQYSFFIGKLWVAKFVSCRYIVCKLIFKLCSYTFTYKTFYRFLQVFQFIEPFSLCFSKSHIFIAVCCILWLYIFIVTVRIMIFTMYIKITMYRYTNFFRLFHVISFININYL